MPSQAWLKKNLDTGIQKFPDTQFPNLLSNLIFGEKHQEILYNVLPCFTNCLIILFTPQWEISVFFHHNFHSNLLRRLDLCTNLPRDFWTQLAATLNISLSLGMELPHKMTNVRHRLQDIIDTECQHSLKFLELLAKQLI